MMEDNTQETQKHWTQEDLEGLRKQRLEITKEIKEAEAYIEKEKFGSLLEKYKKELIGKVVMSMKPNDDGYSKYLYIAGVSLKDDDGRRFLLLNGYCLSVTLTMMCPRGDDIRLDLDETGNLVNAFIGTEDVQQNFFYRIVDADELSSPTGCVRTMIHRALDLRNQVQAQNGQQALERFLQGFQGLRKEYEKRNAADSKPTGENFGL
jgi:hypothetical protein